MNNCISTNRNVFFKRVVSNSYTLLKCVVSPFILTPVYTDIGVVYGQRKPPNYQQNEMPPTSFSCKDKIVGGYYADPETSCQMFHVCVNVVGTGVSK